MLVSETKTTKIVGVLFFSSRSDYEKTNLKNFYSCKTAYTFSLGTKRQNKKPHRTKKEKNKQF